MKRILIIEGNVERCLALSDFLGNLGFETGVADTGLRAMSMLANANPLPDFILLDVKLSNSSNWGFSDMLQLHEAYKNIPVILMGDESVGEEIKLNADFNKAVIVKSLLAHYKQ